MSGELLEQDGIRARRLCVAKALNEVSQKIGGREVRDMHARRTHVVVF
jgi:hypothetical protein